MMRSRNLLFIFTLLGISILVESCKNPLKTIEKLSKSQELVVQPNPLVLHGETVPFKMSAKLPVKMMQKKTEYELQVFYSPTTDIANGAGGEMTKLGSLVFDGDKYVNATEEPKVESPMTFKYEEKFKQGGLFIKGIARRKGKDKSKEFGPFPLKVKDGSYVAGVATTVRLVRNPTDGLTMGSNGESPFAYSEFTIEEPTANTQSMRLDFAKGSASVNPNFGVNSETIKAADLFIEAKTVPATALNLDVVSSHSPEGSEATNTGLANNRAKALSSAFQRKMMMAKYKKEELDKYKFTAQPKILDATIDEFETLVGASSLSSDDKNDAISTMKGDGDFVTKERALQGKPYYNQLMDEVYPKMRYAKVSLTQAGSSKTEPEMIALAEKIIDGKEKAESLKEEEFLLVASKESDYAKKIKILEAGVKQYDTWKMNNSLGAAYLDISLFKKNNQNVDDAITVLKNANSKRETAEAYYNLGMAYSMKGDSDSANENFKKAVSMGGSGKVKQMLNGVEAYYAIKDAQASDDGKYSTAVDLLNSASASTPNTFNKGLALLMQGNASNYDSAKSQFEKLSSNDAKANYALAVVAARQGDKASVVSALKKAIQLDGSLAKVAMEDVEFYKFFGDSVFKDALK